MNLPNQCKELWLEGITDVYLYPIEECKLSVPSCVAQVLSMNNVVLPEHVLRITTIGEQEVTASSITAKQTPNLEAIGTVYTYEISSNIEVGSDVLRNSYKDIKDKDYIVVLKLEDDTLRLCHTLPGTFSVRMPLNVNNNGQQRSVTIYLKSLSEFIPITLKSIVDS